MVAVSISSAVRDASGAPRGVEQTLGDVSRLRSQLERMQGHRLDAPVLPVDDALATLLSGGGLKPGAMYAVAGSMSLVFALMSRPSREGTWCAALGMPELGAEAAERMGVDLTRLVLVPDPGSRWLAVVATICEVVPVVAVRPPMRAGDAEISRLSARLRDRGAVLLVEGPWPQAEAMISVGEVGWSGLGDGHGCLAAREATVTVSSRRSPVPRSARLLLPGADGRVAAVPPRIGAGAGSPWIEAERMPRGEAERMPRLEAVG